jgi:flagellar hook-length control protein FliK
VPEISSVFVLPTAPAAPIAASPAAAATTSAPDKGAVDFLSQFKAAIKNLAGVALPQVATPVVSALVAQTDAAVVATDSAPADAKKADAKQSQLMPEILAALGFVVVPPLLQPPVVSAQPTDTASPAAAIADAGSPAAAQPLPLSAGAPQSSPTPQAPVATESLQSPQVPAAVQSLPVLQSVPQAAQTLQSPLAPPAIQTPVAAASAPLLDQLQAIPAQPLNIAQQELLTTVVQTAVPQQHASAGAPKTDTTIATPAVISQVTPVYAAPANVAQAAVAVDAPAAPQQPAAAPVADSATPIVASQPAGTFQQSGFDSNSKQPRSTPVVESASATTATEVAPNATFAAAASMATQNTAAVPADLQPAQVVNQIAHQADLYRVPGDRSVRIQLHPEGLGGVDVTLRYSVANGIQLHLNVEHAATGALVQAGWTDLRDALATQGIHANRLVMSISAPANASGLDFSNGTGSHRSDSGLASFTQGQNSQQRQETQDQRAARGWNGTIDPILPSSNDATPRVATAGAGHIDYRV